MLLELFFVPILSLIDFVLGLLPTMSLPTDMVAYVQSAFLLVSSLGAVIPLDTFRNVILTVIAFYGIQFIVSFSNWAFRKIPTIS